MAKLGPPGWRLTNKQTGQSVDLYPEKRLTAFEAHGRVAPEIGNPPFNAVEYQALPPREIEPAPRRPRRTRRK